jgi:hypothetical protein
VAVVDERAIAERYRLLSEQGVLDERGRRLWAAAEARSAGRGGIAAVVRATGISESTVLRGLADLDSGEVLEPGRVRRAGAGRVPILEREPGLGEDLEALVDPVTRGDPQSPLRWTSKSAAKLAEALREIGHDVVDRTVLRLLKAKGYSLQANQKTREGASDPDRDAQFEQINRTVAEAIAAGQPAISIDSKKRELVGISRPWDGSSSRRALRCKCAATTSRTNSWGTRSPTACSTSPATRAGSTSAEGCQNPGLRWNVGVAGVPERIARWSCRSSTWSSRRC